MVTAIPDVFVKDIEAFLHDTHVSDFCKTPIDRLAREFLSVERSGEQVRELSRFAAITPTSRVLEVGSGFGTFVYYCRVNDICDCHGLEPGLPPYAATLDISRRLLDSAGIPASVIEEGIGESMPYADASFDAIYSVSCLEHTQDPKAVLSEVARVLKPGGVAVINFPNYGSWWEGHYNFFMLPHTPKWLFKIIARLRGRSPDFADTLQFITYGKLMGWLAPLKDKVDIVSTGQEIFRERVNGLQFSEWNGLGAVKQGVGLLKRLHLDQLLIRIGIKLHWETPFVLVLRRKA
ncbi:SAM-dependent methyltransferase [Bosea sp. BE125]|uniref:class I SAM-dependent methyltransferase n=1 Tax=Bosea sp. BE125 TaxID=2817909 RepID=UPI00285ACB50|nr:class I SAM-dependent methyltransferase [Bosea sp. BE125]MDR6874168.1 SAM-dependent methyltransferase [Bosea sp. BE125]